MKKYLRFTAAILCIAMLAGCGDKGPKEGPETEETVTSVEIENPTINTVKDEFMYSGTIQAADTVDVSAKVQGTVAATYFEVGDTVKKGDVLYKIDDTDYQNSLKTAQASLNSAKQGVNTANASVASAKTAVDTANGASMQTQLESAKTAVTNAETSLENAKKGVSDTEVQIANAQTNYDKAKSDYDMNKQLFDVGGISEDGLNNYKISFEQAENALTTAQNSKAKAELGVKSAEDALAQAKTSYSILEKQMTAENTRKAKDSLNTAQAGVGSAQASVASAQVGVENAKQQIAYCTVTSPISGTVLSKKVTAGAMASGVGYQIVDLSSVNVQVNVSEQIATAVKLGDAVTIIVPSLDETKQIVGTISELPPGANTDGTYTVKINIPNAKGELRGGMFAKVYFAKSTSNNAVIVPRNSVLDDGNGNYYLFTSDGKTAKKVDVTVGIDTGDSIEVTSGIDIADKVVTKGQTYLADGDKINVVSDNGEEIEQTTEATTAPADKKKDSKGDKKK